GRRVDLLRVYLGLRLVDCADRAADDAVRAVVRHEHRELLRGVETRNARFTVDFPEDGLEFAVQNRARARERDRGRLRGQRRETVEQRGDVVQRAVLNLERRQTVARVPDAL